MKFEFDTKVLKEENIDVDDFLYLLSLYLNTPIITKNCYNNVASKGYTYCIKIDSNLDPIEIELTPEGTDLVESILHDSKEKINTKEESIDELVTKLRELYPKGKKEGTAYMWRDSQAVITKRIKAFFLKYGRYSNEKIITATKKYIDSFNGVYTYMQLLKYFISKKIIIDGEIEETSQLLSYIENPEDNEINNEWVDIK